MGGKREQQTRAVLPVNGSGQETIGLGREELASDDQRGGAGNELFAGEGLRRRSRWACCARLQEFFEADLFHGSTRRRWSFTYPCESSGTWRKVWSDR